MYLIQVKYVISKSLLSKHKVFPILPLLRLFLKTYIYWEPLKLYKHALLEKFFFMFFHKFR